MGKHKVHSKEGGCACVHPYIRMTNHERKRNTSKNNFGVAHSTWV